MTVNIKTVAKIAGVSISTVSKIINNYSDVSDETKQRVMKIMQEIGYIPSNSAKTLATKKSNLIGVIFAGKLNIDFTHPFFVEVLNAFKKQMGFLGYDLLFFSNENFHPAGDEYLARCQHFQVDGCIIISGQEVEHGIYSLDNSKFPCIGVDLQLTGQNSGNIMSDNFKISTKVVEHFYLMGYREIGYIGSTSHSEISNMREQGLIASLENFGLTVNPHMFIHSDTFFEPSGYDAMTRLIESGHVPRAIFAGSDLLAIGAMRALKQHGYRIPEDVAIIGCDDIEASRYTSPSLTTIKQNKEKIGKLAAMMLFDIINNQMYARNVVVETELIIRESCGSKLTK
ncbi:MAG: LacI family transcriptional regulator [Bacilli bacterium]|nr:LacI family transcriptional regulator [Bacilli bacterium]